MELKEFYMHMSGYVNISVEGFFVERFINSCFSRGIFLWDLEREKPTYLKARIGSKDFKKIRKIAKNTKCKVKIISKKGFPIIISKYKKRKIFFAFFILMIFSIFMLTRFIWNIEIVGNENISDIEIIKLLEENKVKVGTLKRKVDAEKLINKIRLERNDISWIGIDIIGTKLKVSINESDLAPETEDPNEICNIVADKDGEIASILVQNGTARVKTGDFVKKGDILVEGIMEGKYTGIRNVPARAEIFAKILLEKEEKVSLKQEKEAKTGNKEKRVEIKLNKIKINFNKRLSKFEKYDTIIKKKKFKLFSNYYFPIEITETTYFETRSEQIEYTVEELTNITKMKLEKDLNQKIGSENLDNITEELEIENLKGELLVRLKYIVLERIGTKEMIK